MNTDLNKSKLYLKKGKLNMGRLTWRDPKTGKIYLYSGDSDVIGKLAEYEDLAEQGLLLRLPCKVGDCLWFLKDFEHEPTCGEIINIIINSAGLYAGVVEYDEKDEFDEWCIPLAQIGKTVFLNKEEAELYLDNQE